MSALSRRTSILRGCCTRCKATTYTRIQSWVKTVYAMAPRKLVNILDTRGVASRSGGLPVNSSHTMGRRVAMYSSWSKVIPSSDCVCRTPTLVKHLSWRLHGPKTDSTALT